MVNKRVRNAVLGCNVKNDRMISVHFQGKPFNITVIQVYPPTSNAEEAEVEWFYEDLQDLLELTPKKDVLFIVGDWNAKVGSQETPGVTGKLGLGIHNEKTNRVSLRKCTAWMQSQKWQNDLCSFPRQNIQYTVIQVYVPTRNVEESEFEQFCENLQDLLELTLKKDVHFIIGDWNTKVGSQDLDTWTNRQTGPCSTE